MDLWDEEDQLRRGEEYNDREYRRMKHGLDMTDSE